MDVYIGLGLLSAGVVVLVFMIFDGWVKNRNARMSDMSGLHNKTIENPEFTLGESRHVHVPRMVTRDPEHSGLTDLCEEDHASSPPEIFPEENIEQPAPREEIMRSYTVQKKDPLPEKSIVMPPNLLVLSVMAKKNGRFESYDLLQAISAAGLQFGEMNIFHYYHATPVGKIKLFSLASANKPGDFDLNNIAEFSCSGLMLFMDIVQVPDPQYAFKLMLDVAERLTEDLDATLCADPLTSWNEKVAWQYHQKNYAI